VRHLVACLMYMYHKVAWATGRHGQTYVDSEPEGSLYTGLYRLQLPLSWLHHTTYWE
jgi:hypothetical protein